MQPCTDEVHELLTGSDIIEKYPGEGGGGCYRVLFLYSPDLHAHMLGFDNNGNASR
jgi:hypothetical protein